MKFQNNVAGSDRQPRNCLMSAQQQLLSAIPVAEFIEVPKRTK
jgi:hypothetical protein